RAEGRCQLVEQACIVLVKGCVVAVAHQLDAAPAPVAVAADGHQLVADAVGLQTLTPSRAACKVALRRSAQRNAGARSECDSGLAGDVAVLFQRSQARQCRPEVELADATRRQDAAR